MDSKTGLFAKAPVPSFNGNRALYLTCIPRTDHSGNGTQRSIRASRPLQLSTSSLLPSMCLGLPESLPYNPSCSILRANYLQVSFGRAPP